MPDPHSKYSVYYKKEDDGMKIEHPETGFGDQNAGLIDKNRYPILPVKIDTETLISKIQNGELTTITVAQKMALEEAGLDIGSYHLTTIEDSTAGVSDHRTESEGTDFGKSGE